MRVHVALFVACCSAVLATAVAVAAAQELRVLQADARPAFFVGIAAPPSAAAVVRAFNRSLAEISRSYFAGDYQLHLRNVTLQPLYIELPEDERFSARVLEQACSALAGRRVASLLVCGGGAAAAAVVTAASRAGVPVLRTSPSHLHLSYTIANELLPLEIRLEITARETLHALRATLLHTHWHTFTLLAEENMYSSLFLRKDLSSILTTQPLNPKWLSLPTKYSRHAIFRRLAEVSRLTRGVVVLICDIHYAKVVMDEAKRLNMLDGHFFWLWIDSSSKFDVFHNIANSTQYTEDDDRDFNIDKNEILHNDGFGRRKRDITDNNPIADEHLRYSSEESNKMSNENVISKYLLNIGNNSESRFFRYSRENVNKSKTHIKSHLLSINFSQSFDISQNGSLESVRNLNIDNKGVESSKIGNKSLEKERNRSFNNNDIINRDISISSNIENESFNKYVNSIHVDDWHNAKELLEREYLEINKENEDLKDRVLFSSDISDFLMNPTVHTSTINNVRDKIVKRMNTIFMKGQKFDYEKDITNENKTSFFNSLPIGLLALYPQPMVIDQTFIQSALRLAVGALRRVLHACDAWSAQAQFLSDATGSCWEEPSDAAADFSIEFISLHWLTNYEHHTEYVL